MIYLYLYIFLNLISNISEENKFNIHHLTIKNFILIWFKFVYKFPSMHVFYLGGKNLFYFKCFMHLLGIQ